MLTGASQLLALRSRAPAYELKFALSLEVAAKVEAWARCHLQPDPFADGKQGDTYHIASIYFDTDDYAVYRRMGSYARSKYRIRRYNTESIFFLERKLKARGEVRKWRTVIPAEQIQWLRDQPPNGWNGSWFLRRLKARELAPRCQISYTRVARVGAVPAGNVRLTLDRRIRARVTDHWELPPEVDGEDLLADLIVLELKYPVTLPPLFKDLMAEFQLESRPVSKYRLALQQSGLMPDDPAP